MAGAETMRVERYGAVVRDPALVAERADRGLAAQPLAVTISRSLRFDPDLPLLADPESHLVVMTPSAGGSPCRARVSYLRGPVSAASSEHCATSSASVGSSVRAARRSTPSCSVQA